MRIIFTSFLYFFVLFSLQAQPTETVSATAHQYLIDNPAAVGLDGRHHIFLGGNKKWFGLEDAPQTYYINTAHTLANRAFGIGGTLIQDKAGLISNTRLSVQTAIHFNPESDNVFSVGVSGRVHFFSFDRPNVQDAAVATGLDASKVNLGLGLNYHRRMSGNSFFNAYALLSQFPSSINLREEAAYAVPNYLILQANLRYYLANGLALTPSLRWQTQASGGFGSKTNIVDLGVGLSFNEDQFSVRLGTRTGEATTIYGGIGVRFGENIRANVFVEPGGRLGTSGTFDAEFVFGEKPNPDDNDTQVNEDKKPKKKKKDRKSKVEEVAWNDLQALKMKVYEAGLNLDDFRVELFKDPIQEKTLILYTFTDKDDNYYDFFEHPDFLARKPLNSLFKVMNDLQKTVEAEGLTITNVNLIGQVKEPLNQDSGQEWNTSNVLAFDYLEEGASQSLVLQKGVKMKEGELAALKLNNLEYRLKKMVPTLKSIPSKIEVTQQSSMAITRRIRIGITVDDY